MGTIEGLLDQTPETPEYRAIREEGERIRKALPSIDFGHPGARKTRPEAELTKKKCKVCPRQAVPTMTSKE
jgi:hypothetical protein